MKEKRIALFSFGSGMCSSFYSMTVRSGEKLDILIDHLSQHVPIILEKRLKTPAIEFEKILENRELTYNKGNLLILLILTKPKIVVKQNKV